ncbi:hypothetical protein [Streptomyces coeruleorubidus]|uniref:hypothetical protein n=1 Tax=Streptomyces coeruleorubidus TaxID=116188 RepID=UPI00123CFE0C|nr:hypothetical protein [Streptomyces coeruleorubidus]GGT50097.1 hypothetical protein GCM10010256_03010 [Streptomyces coeruleorubidus]
MNTVPGSLRRTTTAFLMAVALLTASPFMASSHAASDINIGPGVDAESAAFVKAHPKEVATMANLCGAEYDTITLALRLPTDASRLGTLWVYGGNGAGSSQNTCSVFDNNTGTSKWMKLQLCDNYTNTPCDVDQGTFSQYAGPVWQKPGGCGTVTALMKASSSSSTYLINRVADNVTNCN